MTLSYLAKYSMIQSARGLYASTATAELLIICRGDVINVRALWSNTNGRVFRTPYSL